MAGRGKRLLESLQKLKKDEQKADEGQTSQASAPPLPTAPIGRGRGKLIQSISKLKAERKDGSPEREPSPSGSSGDGSSSSGQPSPSGPVGSPPEEEMAAMALEEAEEPPRPVYPAQPDPIFNKLRGSDGTTIPLALNYVKLTQREGLGIYEYHIRFTPNIDSRQLRAKILRQPAVVDKIGTVMQFTGMNLFLPKHLDNLSITTTTPIDESEVRIDIEFIKVPPFQELIPFYNTMFRKIMKELAVYEATQGDNDIFNYFNGSQSARSITPNRGRSPSVNSAKTWTDKFKTKFNKNQNVRAVDLCK